MASDFNIKTNQMSSGERIITAGWLNNYSVPFKEQIAHFKEGEYTEPDNENWLDNLSTGFRDVILGVNEMNTNYTSNTIIRPDGDGNKVKIDGIKYGALTENHFGLGRIGTYGEKISVSNGFSLFGDLNVIEANWVDIDIATSIALETFVDMTEYPPTLLATGGYAKPSNVRFDIVGINLYTLMRNITNTIEIGILTKIFSLNDNEDKLLTLLNKSILAIERLMLRNGIRARFYAPDYDTTLSDLVYVGRPPKKAEMLRLFHRVIKKLKVASKTLNIAHEETDMKIVLISHIAHDFISTRPKYIWYLDTHTGKYHRKEDLGNKLNLPPKVKGQIPLNPVTLAIYSDKAGILPTLTNKIRKDVSNSLYNNSVVKTTSVGRIVTTLKRDKLYDTVRYFIDKLKIPIVFKQVDAKRVIPKKNELHNTISFLTNKNQLVNDLIRAREADGQLAKIGCFKDGVYIPPKAKQTKRRKLIKIR